MFREVRFLAGTCRNGAQINDTSNIGNDFPAVEASEIQLLSLCSFTNSPLFQGFALSSFEMSPSLLSP